MKKIALIAFAVIAVAIMAPRQAAAQVAMTNPNGLAIDTGSQAAAEGPSYQFSQPAKTLTIVVKTLKISGTIAGTVAWQGSNDGTNYATISTTALVDASTNYQYKEVDKGFKYYKALITQTGTSSLSYQAKAFTSPPR